MNKIIFATLPWLFAAIGYKATAQVDVKTKDDKKNQSQEIVIRKKGEKDVTVNIQFKDDKVIVNGKPLVEFKDDAITINNRTYSFKQIEKDFEGFERDMEGFGRDMEDFGREMEMQFGGDNMRGNMGMSGTFLGVVTEKVDEGAKINEVVKESAAEKAGLKEGDIITKIEDKKVNGPGELAEIVGEMQPKKEVKIAYKRDGKEKTAKAILQERKVSEVRNFSFSTPDGGVKAYSVPRPPRVPRAPGGMAPELFDFNDNEIRLNGTMYGRPKLGLKIQDLEEGEGVKVLEVEEGSAAATAGIKKDDVITEIGTVKVANTDDAREQLQANSSKSTYTIAAKRNNTAMKFDIKIPKKLKTANL